MRHILYCWTCEGLWEKICALVSVGFVLAYGGHCGYFWVSGSRFRCCKHFIRVDLVSGEVTLHRKPVLMTSALAYVFIYLILLWTQLLTYFPGVTLWNLIVFVCPSVPLNAVAAAGRGQWPAPIIRVSVIPCLVLQRWRCVRITPNVMSGRPANGPR